MPVRLFLCRFRVACPTCGPRLEDLDWLEPRSRAWEDWLARAQESRLTPLKAFARNLAKRIDGILAQCRWKLNTSILEGINNKAKVIKRMAYGFRDDDYFALKIHSAFPGNAR